MNAERKRTTMSLRAIARAVEHEHKVSVSHVTIGEILESIGYRKQKNQKVLQVGKDHPDRDLQFKHESNESLFGKMKEEGRTGEISFTISVVGNNTIGSSVRSVKQMAR